MLTLDELILNSILVMNPIENDNAVDLLPRKKTHPTQTTV